MSLVQVKDNGTTKVLWSTANTGSAKTVNQPYTDASGQLLPPVVMFHGGPGGALTPNAGGLLPGLQDIDREMLRSGQGRGALGMGMDADQQQSGLQ